MGVVVRSGLDESFGMSYTRFDSVQQRLARAIGIQLVTMEGHGGATSWEGITDALVPFLRQNCDGGKLSLQECFAVRRRIWELSLTWPREQREWIRDFALPMAQCAFLGRWLTWG